MCLRIDTSPPSVELQSFRDTEDHAGFNLGDRLDTSAHEWHHVVTSLCFPALGCVLFLPETVYESESCTSVGTIRALSLAMLDRHCIRGQDGINFRCFRKMTTMAIAIWRRKVHEMKCENQTSTTLLHMPDRLAIEDEIELVVEARNGATSAVEQLVDRYEARIFRMAQNITSNPEDAEEVVQNVFLKAFRNLANFRGDSRFYTWLVRIAINESLMKVRGRCPQNISINDVSKDEDRTVLRELAHGARILKSNIRKRN
jgi:hypothetical protein